MTSFADTTTKSLDHAKTLARLQKLSRIMDTAWRIPLTRWRFGLDSVLGLIPGAGDFINVGVSAYAILLARRLGAPNSLLIKMAANSAIDFGLGTVPIVGDVFDMFFKSNSRNLKLLTDYLENQIAK